MARRIREEDLQAIEEAVRPYPEGRTARQIGDALASAPARRTLQYRIKSLVDGDRLIMEGRGRWARYRAPRRISVAAQPVAAHGALGVARGQVIPPLSEPAAEIREHVRQPLEARHPVGYDRAFLDSYRPGETFLSIAGGTRTPSRSGDAEDPRAARRHLRQADPEQTADRSVLEFKPAGGKHLFPARHNASARDRGRSGRQGATRSADDPQPQGRHRVSGRWGRGHRLQSLHPSQPSRAVGGQPAGRPGGDGASPAYRRGYRGLGLSSAGDAAAHPGMLRPGSCGRLRDPRPL